MPAGIPIKDKMPNEESLKRRYERVYHELRELLLKTENKTARMATVAALLHHKMPRFSWTGFYILTEGELIVGPYQGPLACQVLEKRKGACWAGILQAKTIIIPDVHKFPGHIACDSRSNSEIVVPLFNKEKEVWAVLDVDSRKLSAFSYIDKEWLEKIVKLIE
jgi:L-methionine (R)-S-oxide reductase